jgi:hypothetical protein
METMMAKLKYKSDAIVVIKGMSLKQAEEFVNWYEGQGEQNAADWFEENGLRAPVADVSRKGGCICVEEIDGGDTGDEMYFEEEMSVTLYCR